jgi:acetylornithine deacetylase/succinyl-diaminopimelate desuccinylase-like protein
MVPSRTAWRVSRAVIVACALGARPAGAQAGASPQDSLARAILSELVGINSSVSGGGVGQAAQAVERRLLDAGYPAADVVLAGPDSTFRNVVATLHGHDAAAPPILLLAHLDVVEALRSDWSFDPYTLREADRWLYGRGTLDDKGGAAVLVATMLRLRAEGYVPSRDVIMVLTTDEESTAEHGIQWLLAHRPALAHAEYALNTDAGGVSLRNGTPRFVAVQAAEKVYATFRLEVRNRGGHSSEPRDDNAIYQLAQGLVRIGRHRFPVQYSPITRAYFARAARLERGQLGADLAAAGRGETEGAAIERLLRSPAYGTHLRTTCVATMLQGGHAENALPQTAAATVNCRMMPGTAWQSVRATLQRVVGDTAIRIEPASEVTPSPASPLRPDVFRAIEAAGKSLWPDAPLIPTMSNGASDGLYLRNAGVPVYGASGLALDPVDDRSHGRDERIGVRAFYDSREFWYRLVKGVTAHADAMQGAPNERPAHDSLNAAGTS